MNEDLTVLREKLNTLYKKYQADKESLWLLSATELFVKGSIEKETKRAEDFKNKVSFYPFFFRRVVQGICLFAATLLFLASFAFLEIPPFVMVLVQVFNLGVVGFALPEIVYQLTMQSYKIRRTLKGYQEESEAAFNRALSLKKEEASIAEQCVMEKSLLEKEELKLYQLLNQVIAYLDLIAPNGVGETLLTTEEYCLLQERNMILEPTGTSEQAELKLKPTHLQ